MKVMRSLALAGAFLLACLLPANALTITDDQGGIISKYIEKYVAMNLNGEKIVIDGKCFSACTTFLGIIPKERVCVTPRAKLGFHTATRPLGNPRNRNTKWAHATEWTEAMWSLYPMHVRDRVKRKGWNGDNPFVPHTKFVVLEGFDLRQILPVCGDQK